MELTRFFRFLKHLHISRTHPVIRTQMESIEDKQTLLAEALWKRIADELKESNVEVLHPSSEADGKELFSIIISDKTLDYGIVYLQHIKPKVREEIHVSSLRDNILMKLGLIKNNSY